MENERNNPGSRRIPVETDDGRTSSRDRAGDNAGSIPGGAETPERRSRIEPENEGKPFDQGAEAELEQLEAQLREMEDRWRRTAADLDNNRKRFQRELTRTAEIQRESVLRPWLEVVDNMERALASEGAQSNPWFDGMEAIHQQMLVVLRQAGVEPFDALGEMFDPQRHEAVATANIAGKPEGLIVEAVQTGYAMGGKVLRPARVIPIKHG